MAAPMAGAGEFGSWLNDRLDSLEVDREVYGAYILGVLQEEESDEEKGDALQGILSAFLVNIRCGIAPVVDTAVTGSLAHSDWTSVVSYERITLEQKCWLTPDHKTQGSCFAHCHMKHGI